MLEQNYPLQRIYNGRRVLNEDRGGVQILRRRGRGGPWGWGWMPQQRSPLIWLFSTVDRGGSDPSFAWEEAHGYILGEFWSAFDQHILNHHTKKAQHTPHNTQDHIWNSNTAWESGKDGMGIWSSGWLPFIWKGTASETVMKPSMVALRKEFSRICRMLPSR